MAYRFNPFTGKLDDIADSWQSNDPAFDDVFTSAVVDANNRVIWATRPDGSIFQPVQQLPVFGQLHSSAGLHFVDVDGFGRCQVYLSGNSVSQLTSTGNNWDPAFTAESPQRLMFQSDRDSAFRYWVMNADGSRQAPSIPPRNDITFWGDSMTQRLVTQNSFAAVTSPALPQLLSGRTLTYNALGSATVEDIIARQGGEPSTCIVVGNSIPASGAVNLQNVWPSVGMHAGTFANGATYSYLVTIAGVQGTLTSTTVTVNSAFRGNYTFTRTSSGSAVPVSGPQEIILLGVISAGQVSVNSFKKSNTMVFWMGTNNISGLPSTTYDPTVSPGTYFKSPATTYDFRNNSQVTARASALVQNLINRVENLDRRVLICGPFIGQGQVWATTDEKQAIVDGFSTFSKHWFDLRSAFLAPTQLGFATTKAWFQARYPDLASTWVSADDTNVANGASPTVLREDNIHLNARGSRLVAELIDNQLSQKRW
jgi:hypothetical protein